MLRCTKSVRQTLGECSPRGKAAEAFYIWLLTCPALAVAYSGYGAEAGYYAGQAAGYPKPQSGYGIGPPSARPPLPRAGFGSAAPPGGAMTAWQKQRR